ncbi:MAG: pyruvate, phosphate dikinase [Bacteroidia bacterium]|nr:pyruvate, phosphate dikinase [Bacteroidia bacterium]
MNPIKYVYTFGGQASEGNAGMKNLLGGKGANLAEMSLLGIPVPAGFTITTETCAHYYAHGREALISALRTQVEAGIRHIESVMGGSFGNAENPLLVSVRSGARVSMPGMMDTVLNLGLNDEVVAGMAARMDNPRAAWDSYRRFVQMYGDVVMDLKPASKEEIDPFEAILEALKAERGVTLDTELDVEDLQDLTRRFKRAIRSATGKEFPTDPWVQLWGAIEAVFNSWMNDRAITYRRLNRIPEAWGTAVNVQAMVFGNLGSSSATGVAFTRDPATGDPEFVGEYLINAQGEDVVAGIRTPQQITRSGSQRWARLANIPESVRKEKFPSLEEVMPELYAELHAIQLRLERHYHDMQDIEFTIQDGRLWMLQTRNGKRTGRAMVKIALDMWREGLIDDRTAILRIDPKKLDELLHPVFDPKALAESRPLAQGLPASPGAATGQIVFFADDAAEWAKEGKQVILVRIETSPEDIQGMDAAQGILTTRGGMTSHAAVVARGMGKCCVSGAGSLHVDYHQRMVCEGNVCLREGDWISLNGSDGQIYPGRIATRDPDLSGDMGDLMALADRFARMRVRANADTPHDAAVARGFGAQGIGLCRTEHMFFEGERIKLIREMILAPNPAGRQRALDQLLPIQRKDFEGIFDVMEGLPITIRFLDPPLHEFLPKEESMQQQLAKEMGIPFEQVQHKVEELSEVNPMLGLRGCRVGNIFPEITEMQTRAILEAALNLKRFYNREVIPEIMVPLISSGAEFERQVEIIRETADKVFAERKDRVEYKVGSMIEVPRAAIVADQIALSADFFSFGTNDLTQLTFGFSRDDVADFLPQYLERGLLKVDPFQTLDPDGVGALVEMGTKKGREAHPGLKVGICGEHGGDPDSIAFCHRAGLDYVSCSPYRVPVAKLVAAQVVIKEQAAAAVPA